MAKKVNKVEYIYDEIKALKYNALVKVAKSLEGFEFKMEKQDVLTDKILLHLGLIKESEIAAPPVTKAETQRKIEDKFEDVVSDKKLSDKEKALKLKELGASTWKIKTLLNIEYNVAKELLGIQSATSSAEPKTSIVLSTAQQNIVNGKLPMEKKVKELFGAGLPKWQIARVLNLKYSEVNVFFK